MDEKNLSGEQQGFTDKMFNAGVGSVVGGVLGETLSNPIEALAEDIRNARIERENRNNTKVHNFQGRSARETQEMRDRVAKNRRKRYIPRLGLPNSATALAGMTIGGAVANPMINKLKEKSEVRKLTRDLEKEASECYANVPVLQKPFFF